MCNHPHCQNALYFYRSTREGLFFQRAKCGTVFRAANIGLELYDNGGAYEDCQDCVLRLIYTPKYDNGFIFRCARCGRFYRLFLLELIAAQRYEFALCEN